jgi:hypothetical protein
MSEITEKELDQVVDRVQKLVDQYHEQNVAIATMRGEMDIRLHSFSQELRGITERIPAHLSEQVIGFALKLDELMRNVRNWNEGLKTDYVGRTEFEILKVEHDQIKRLMWGFIAMVLTAVVGGVIALVFKG